MDDFSEAVPYDVDSLRRSEFPWTAERGAVYLNSASTGPLPERTRRAIQEFTAMATRPDESLYEAHREVPARGRRACAELIGAQPEEIALGANTTYGLNLAASALGLGPGDRVLLMDGEFPANVYPWLNLQSRGVVVEFVARDERGWPVETFGSSRPRWSISAPGTGSTWIWCRPSAGGTERIWWSMRYRRWELCRWMWP
jgi:selenocysteine lyase/cysteine desulfurase